MRYDTSFPGRCTVREDPVSTSVRPSHAPPPPFTLQSRSAGLLLHPTSLPGPHGSGDLGPCAREFVDFLADSGLTWWQTLPTGPIHTDGSPYSSDSAFAGNPLLISLDDLVARGLLTKADLKAPPALKADRVNYPAMAKFRMSRLRKAFMNFATRGGTLDPLPGSEKRSTSKGARPSAAPRGGPDTAVETLAGFTKREGSWLANFALFSAAKANLKGKPWNQWPTGLAAFAPEALVEAADEYRDEYAFASFLQYIFTLQWSALRKYASERGIGLMGDIPIFVSLDSADVWAHRRLWDLDERGRPRTVSGYPPDMFSKDGQLWGHPQYDWAAHERSGFEWWIARFRRMFAQFDAVRIDHFLGFARVWAVPAGQKTARNGRWVATPGSKLFAALQREIGDVPIIAEDLGDGTREAYALRDRHRFPGMRILQFGFGDNHGNSYHRPHTYVHTCAVYPGTHDSDTALGWFKSSPVAVKQRVLNYTGTTGRDIAWDFVRLAWLSPANTAICQVQDALGLDGKSRMNTPGTNKGNWQWRMKPGALTPALAKRLRELTEVCGRRG